MRKPRRSTSATNKQTKPIISTSLLLILTVGAFFELERPSSSKAQSAPQLTSSARATNSHAIEERDQVRPPAAGADQLFGKLPLSFEANEGQFDSRATYVARGEGYGLFLTRTGAVLSLRKHANPQARPQTASANPAGTHFEELPSVLSLRFEGANASARITALDELPGRVNYFIGNDARKWRRNIQTYAKVRYGNVYPGVDVIYYGNQRQLEYDFVLAPGADPHRIRLGFRGATAVKVDESGDLVLTIGKDDVHQRKPIAYQEVDGQRREVSARYQVESNRVTLKLGDYDKRRPLVIDPVLIYSSFLGGTSSEDGLGIAVDAQGSAYLTGSTLSTDFPLANALQATKDTATDAFVVKLNPVGTAFVYSTYLGANGSDTGNSIAVDAQGNAYVAGLTGSGSFPTTPGVFQNQKSGGIDGFLAKLNPSGSALAYSTFLGGDNSDTIFGVAVDATGRAHVVGRTDSTRLNFLPLQRHGSPAYKSTDAAAHWSNSAAELTASTVNTFAIDPSSSNTVYAGSNVGVFKSIDAGAHWNLTGTSNTGTAPIFTTAVAVDPSNPNIIYAGAQGTGVFKSTNGGPLYAPKNSGLQGAAFLINALAIDPSVPATVYAGTGAGIYKSTNGADTWVEIKNGISGSSPRVNEVVIDPTNPATVYIGTSRGMFKTMNGGALWTPINAGALTNIITPEITALTINPLNPLLLYASGRGINDIIFKTVDGGANWTGGISSGLTYTNGGQSVIPIVNSMGIDPLTPATLYVATSGGAMYKTTDGGTNWSSSNTGITNVIANAVTLDRINPAIVYAGTAIGNDAFIVRFDPSGSVPEYFLNFGGDESDEARGVALDADGNAYIVGTTNSTNFPTINAVQPATGGFSDAFVSKLNAAGSGFVYSTYLGGNSSEQGRAIAVRAGGAYVTGVTSSPNFPLANAFKSTLAQFDTDAFVTKLNPTGTVLDFSSYLGGSAGIDQGFGIAVDSSGSAYVTGLTSSSDFPTLAAPQPGLNGSNDAFVTKLNPGGTALVYSTYLGGVVADQGNGIAVDALGNAYVIGTTSSANFPTVNPFQPTLKGTDAFVTKLVPAVDLAVTMADAPDPVAFGSDLTYTINVKNNGELAASGVTLTDPLPAGANLVSVNSTKGTCSSGNPVTCAIGGLIVGETATVTIIIKPPAIRTISNSAAVSGNEPDGFPANNTATETTTVDFADLAVTKTVVQAQAAPGAKLVYLLRVTNQAGTTAPNVTLTDSLPASLAFVGCSTSAGVCSASGNNVTATLPSIAVGALQTVVVTTTVNPAVQPGTQITNTVSVAAALPDPQLADNSSTNIISVAASTIVPRVNGKIAYASDRNFTPVSEPSGLYTVNADGTFERQFPNTIHNTSRPVWSPDGTKLAFQYRNFAPVGSPEEEIYVINADGTGKLKVAGNAIGTTFFVRAITWSPAGTQLAFVGKPAGQVGPTTIYVVGIDGNGLAPLPGAPTQISDVSWSPDGSRFAFMKNNNIFVIDVDGSNQKQLTMTEQTPDGPTFDWQPRWSPDASKIIFMRSTNNSRSLYTINPDGTGLVTILSTGGEEGSFSPDGTKVLFAVGNEVYWSTLNGATTQRLTNNIYYDSMPDWQPVNVNTVQFAASAQSGGEVDGKVDVLVTRSGNTSAPATVDYSTVDGTAMQNSDYTVTAGTLRFGAGETSKSIEVILADDSYVEGSESFSLILSNPTGAQQGVTQVATINIVDNDSNPNAPNPIDDTPFFVRQHYADFLSRIPDPSGFGFWTGQITQCGSDPICLRNKRIDVSNAFFYELEFQQTGSYVYRLYRAAFGNNQPFPNPIPDPVHPGEEKKVVAYQNFVQDRARVVGGSDLAQAQLDFANAFARRAEFFAKYPNSLGGSGFVDAVVTTIRNDLGVDLGTQRPALISLYDSGGRGAVMYRLADDNLQTNPINNRAFIDAEYNRAFVATQYFGYLRRDPDMAGFLFWLGQVSGAPLRDVTKQHAMVCSFITSGEYQLRFSSVITHTNAECQ